MKTAITGRATHMAILAKPYTGLPNLARRLALPAFLATQVIAIHRKPHTVLRRLTGHPKKMAEPFLVVS